jgi:NAD(P)-dependent dehydrogenase (short-subunit alcohol dehydrogenase family)
VVIGGSAGIGLETARRARAQGADVILTGCNPGPLEQPSPLGVSRTKTRSWALTWRFTLARLLCGIR